MEEKSKMTVEEARRKGGQITSEIHGKEFLPEHWAKMRRNNKTDAWP